MIALGAMAVPATVGFVLCTTQVLGGENVSGDITMIKGPHSADEARFEAMIIDDFKAVEPDVNVEFTTYDWANMNAELTAGFASGNPADVLYLVDLIYPNYAEQGALHDMSDLVNSEDWSAAVLILAFWPIYLANM